MFHVTTYMTDLIARLKQEFGQRLVYVGLQGSYLRGEATEESDIDVMVVIDRMTVTDLKAYRKMIGELPDPERSCGFICGKEELAHWNPLEVCHLLHSTKDYYGELKKHLPSYNKTDIVNFIKLSIGNLQHEISHRYLHADAESNRRQLPYAYRNVFFILQNMLYLRDGMFYPTKAELGKHLNGMDRQVFETMMALKQEEFYDLDAAFELMLVWCQRTLIAL